MKDVSTLPVATAYQSLVARELETSPGASIREAEAKALKSLEQLRGPLTDADKLEVRQVKGHHANREAYLNQAILAETAALLGIDGDALQARLFERLGQALDRARQGRTLAELANTTTQTWSDATKTSLAAKITSSVAQRSEAVAQWFSKPYQNFVEFERSEPGSGVVYAAIAAPAFVLGGLGWLATKPFGQLDRIPWGDGATATVSSAELQPLREAFVAAPPLGQYVISKTLQKLQGLQGPASGDQLRPEAREILSGIVAEAAGLDPDTRAQGDRLLGAMAPLEQAGPSAVGIAETRQRLADLPPADREIARGWLDGALGSDALGLDPWAADRLREALWGEGAPAIHSGLELARRDAFYGRTQLGAEDVAQLVGRPLSQMEGPAKEQAQKELREALFLPDGRLRNAESFEPGVREQLVGLLNYDPLRG